MRLYHFCADRHVKRILREGLNVGGVNLPDGKNDVHIYMGYIWLTSDRDPRAQSWATRHLLGYSRTAWRLTVEIPPEDTGRVLDRSGLEALLPGSGYLWDGWPGSENWRVYHGFIPKTWIKDCERTEA